MNKSCLFSATLTAVIIAASASVANAERHRTSEADAPQAVEPKSGMPAATWAKLMKSWVNGSTVRNQPRVYMINGTGQNLTVECIQNSGKHWALVGPNPYIKGNTATLPAFTVTEESTAGFDGYCDKLVGVASTDDTFVGEMSEPKNFTGSAFIIFKDEAER